MSSDRMAMVPVAVTASEGPVSGVVRERDTPGSLADPRNPSRFPGCVGTEVSKETVSHFSLNNKEKV